MCTCTSLLKKNNETRVGYEHKAFENACMYNVKFEFHNELSMLRHQKNFSEKILKKQPVIGLYRFNR